MPTTPTPPGNPMPPPADVVPVPEFLREQAGIDIVLEEGGSATDKIVITRTGGASSRSITVSSVAAVYILGYQRGWTDSAAHYLIEET